MPVLGFGTLILTCVVAVATTEQGLDRIHRSNGYAESKLTGFEQFEQEIIIPTEVNEDGYPLVHNRYKRNTDSPQKRRISFYGFGELFDLEMDSSFHLLAPGFKVYRLGSTSGKTGEDEQDMDGCLFRGTLKNHPDSMAALNLCGGMSGLLKTGNADYFIEPVSRNSSDITAMEKPHLLKKRSLANPEPDKTSRRNQKFFCGKRRRYMPHKPHRKDHWLPDEFAVAGNNHSAATVRAKRWTRKGRPQRRRSVETLVVADREMVRKHGTENVTSYLLTVFNMVAMLYQDSTIGNNVSVILVGLVLLEGDEPGLTLSYNAETSLSSFCQWQSTVHTTRGRQHDHAVLVTGLDICSWKDEPCDTLGYAPISGMCSKYRSCTVNEDSGLALAFTVAHEIGHNFGMVHDGQGSSPCRRKRGTIMSASLSGLDSSLLWSDCSRRDLANFLESPRSLCLKNEPDSPDELQFPNHLPGQLYDADMQCRLQFGTKSKLCEHYPRKNEVCRALWCQRNGRECETKFLPAAEGTPCGKSKWCRKGSCVSSELYSQRVTDGGWGLFSKWSNCSRPCGGGLMVRERSCDSPPPSNGGSYCKGEEHEYRICETQNCRSDNLEYTNDQCATFNKRTVKGKFYRWKPYGKDLGALSRCRIYCVPDKEDLYLVLSTKLQDGTSCSGNFSGVCIDGECRNVGCDGKIESSVTPDICGVCNGDNSTCKTIKGSFNTSNLTTGYHEVIRIPPDSRSISVSESREYPTYLALQDGKGRYHLNENWILDWPGRYSAAGTMFSYRRWPGQPESLVAKGPTTEDLLVEVFLQEKVEAVISYEFVISSIQARWKMKNSSCSVTCGNGAFLSSPVCVTSAEQVTKNIYCNISKMPGIKSYYCEQEPCSSLWYTGEWSPCNDENCEPRQQIRDVFCMEQDKKVPSFNCGDQIRPIHVRECSRNKCMYRWHTGPWSKCRGICNSGFQTRSVTCRRSINETAESFSNCNTDAQPLHSRKCKSNCTLDEKQNPSVWMTGSWSECNVDCGEGEEKRNVTCIKKYGDSGYPSSTCDPHLKPLSKQICTKANCSVLKNADCEDLYKWCPTSTNERLCKLKFYATNCCISCRKKL